MWGLAAILWIGCRLWRGWRRSRLPFLDYFFLTTCYVYSRLWHRCRDNGPAPFPREGPGVIISNHTCSADPTLILAGSPRLLSFLMAQEHYDLHPLARAILVYMGCVKVARTGYDGGALRRAVRRLREGGTLCIFPEGNLSGVGLGRMRQGRPGMAYLALRLGVPIFPVHIAGGPQTRRLLPSWLFPSRKAARVTYGPAVDLSAFRNRPLERRTLEEAARFLMRKIDELAPDRR